MSGVRRGDLSEMSFAFRIIRGTWSPDYTAYRIEQVDMNRGDVSIVNYGANPDTYLLGSDDDADSIDVDALDDSQALALAGRLEQRSAKRSAARADRAGLDTAGLGAPLMSRDELDALAALAAPHPLAARVQD
jgi:hypothetical protein